MDQHTEPEVETVDEDVEIAQVMAHDAVFKLQAEIIGAIGRLAALHARVGKLYAAIDKLNKGDADGEDYQTLFGIGLLAPVPEDTDAYTVGTLLHQGNIWGGDEGETAIGWMVANVEARVQQIEDEIAPAPEVLA
jgi:hypothetical protein